MRVAYGYMQTMESADEDGVVAVIFLANMSNINRKRKRKRSVWTKSWISKRLEYGAYHSLIQELSAVDHDAYKNFLRMDMASFQELLLKVAPLICKKNTIMRRSIEP